MTNISELKIGTIFLREFPSLNEENDKQVGIKVSNKYFYDTYRESLIDFTTESSYYHVEIGLTIMPHNLPYLLKNF